MKTGKEKRNSFIALCEYATQRNLCWRIACGTCGHREFRYAFSKIIYGKHPDNKSFWSTIGDKYDDFMWGKTPSEEDQIKLASIVAGADIRDIHQVAKFPDWLGYIGLVIFHCKSSSSSQPSRAHKILTDALLPQFIEFTKRRSSLCDYLKNKKESGGILTIDDLEKIEEGLNLTFQRIIL